MSVSPFVRFWSYSAKEWAKFSVLELCWPGKTTTQEILNEVRAIRSGGSNQISIYTFGFGQDVDSDLLWVSE